MTTLGILLAVLFVALLPALVVWSLVVRLRHELGHARADTEALRIEVAGLRAVMIPVRPTPPTITNKVEVFTGLTPRGPFTRPTAPANPSARIRRETVTRTTSRPTATTDVQATVNSSYAHIEGLVERARETIDRHIAGLNPDEVRAMDPAAFLADIDHMINHVHVGLGLAPPTPIPEAAPQKEPEAPPPNAWDRLTEEEASERHDPHVADGSLDGKGAT